MPKQVLFIQGAGDGAYAEDAKLANSLRQALLARFTVQYPAMPNEGDAKYPDWAAWLEMQLSGLAQPVILVGHSVGGSVALKWLSENLGQHPVDGAFILAAPFWGGAGWRYEGYEQLALSPARALGLTEQVPLFLYHCVDDDSVPPDHLVLYQTLLPRAQAFREAQGGHQFGNDLRRIARAIEEYTGEP